jgi:hypothetical protein
MTIEFVLIALAVVLFGVMVAGLGLAYAETEAERIKAAAAERKRTTRPAPSVYQWGAHDDAVAQELMLRQLEHYLRREAMMAEQFINNPSPQTLRVGEHQHLGTC